MMELRELQAGIRAPSGPAGRVADYVARLYAEEEYIGR